MHHFRSKWNRKLVFFTLWVLLFGSVNAHAIWNEKAIADVKKFNSLHECDHCFKGIMNGPFAIAIEDNLFLYMGSLFNRSKIFLGARKETLDLDDDFFIDSKRQRKPFNTFSWKSLSRSKKSPLAVYLPGISQDASDINTYRAVGMLLKAGYHVLLVANPLSSDYLAQLPKSPPVQFEEEAKVIVSAARAFKNSHADEISDVHIVGASYGSFLGAIALALDSESPQPVIDGETTLFFPPIDIGVTIPLLDNIVDEHFRKFISISPKALVGKIFHQGLIDLLSQIQNRYRADKENGFLDHLYPEPAMSNLEKLNLKNSATNRKIRFEKIIRDYISENLEFYSSDKSQISYWLERAKDNGSSKVRVLTTSDDWINRKGAYSQLPQWMLNPSHLLIRKTGGHAGMIGSEWFEKFAVEALRAR